MHWRTARRTLSLDRPLVMGVLNVTPDSFSDGGKYGDVDGALRRAEQMVAEGADIIDIGGESSRPGSSRVDPDIELSRVVPVIEAIAGRFQTPISVDTTKARVAAAALNSGADIINDISGLRWDPDLANVVAASGAAVILMHSLGSFETLHSAPRVTDILAEVTSSLRRSIHVARDGGIADECIALDVGIGFGKSLEQNQQLLATLDTIVSEFAGYPMVIGTSRKSFIGKLGGDLPAEKRIGGSIATAIVAIQRGARIVRVHDVAETVEALRLLRSIES